MVTILSSTISLSMPIKPLCISLYEPTFRNPLSFARPATQALLNRLIVLDLGKTFSHNGDPYSSNTKLLVEVENLRPFVEEFIKVWKKMKPDQQVREKNIILESIRLYDELNLFFNFVSSADRVSFRPVESKLEREAYRRVLSLIRLLPVELRFQIARPKYDYSAQESIFRSKDIIKNLESNIEDLFLKVEGITYEGYVKRLRNSKDERIIRSLHILDNNQMHFTMHRQETRREDIVISGFLNQFITHTSGGTLSPEARDKTESAMLNMPSEMYQNLSALVKPKYGTFMIAEESGVKNDLTMALTYGEDIYVFKTDDLQERMTFYPNDSLAKEAGFLGGLLTNVDSPDWSKRLLPWKFRYLMIPFMLSHLNQNLFSVPFIKRKEIPAEANLKIFDTLQGLFPIPDYSGPDFEGIYWETQYLGSLSLRNAKMFIFTNNPPSGRFLMELRRRNIAIMDGRKQTPQIWNEFDKSDVQNKNWKVPTLPDLHTPVFPYATPYSP